MFVFDDVDALICITMIGWWFRYFLFLKYGFRTSSFMVIVDALILYYKDIFLGLWLNPIQLLFKMLLNVMCGFMIPLLPVFKYTHLEHLIYGYDDFWWNLMIRPNRKGLSYLGFWHASISKSSFFMFWLGGYAIQKW